MQGFGGGMHGGMSTVDPEIIMRMFSAQMGGGSGFQTFVGGMPGGAGRQRSSQTGFTF